jgi:hypothetical protein
MKNIKNIFIENAINHGKAIEKGNHKTANKIHSKLTSIRSEIQKENRWDILQELINHPNESVKCWSATFLLKNNEKVALKVLKNLSKSKKIIGLTAKTTIDMWRKKMFD